MACRIHPGHVYSCVYPGRIPPLDMKQDHGNQSAREPYRIRGVRAQGQKGGQACCESGIIHRTLLYPGVRSGGSRGTGCRKRTIYPYPLYTGCYA